MVRTILTPQNADIHLSIPKNYIGKKVEVMYYLLDELEEETPSNSPEEDERTLWQQFSSNQLSNAFGEDEPDYTLSDIKNPNPEYKPWKEK